MNFKNWLITEEIYPNGTATVYHRTNKENIQNILSNNWKVGGGQMYGAGLYTTFALKSQFTKYMSNYGDALLKFKVKDLNKYVICSTGVARHILGDEYKISDQLKNLNLSDLYTEEQIKNFDEMMSKEVYSSEIAQKMFLTNRNLQKRAKGIIYYGERDGYCLVKYEPIEDGTITLLGYAYVGTNETEKIDALLSNCEKDQEGKCKNPWTTSTELLKIKTLHGLPAEKKQNYATIKIPLLNKPIKDIIYGAKNKDEMAKYIFQHKKDLTENDVETLMSYTKDNEIRKRIIKNKKYLSRNDIVNLAHNSKDPNELVEYIFQQKKDFENFAIDTLLHHATDKDEIAELIIQNKKDNLSDFNISKLLHYATDTDKIIKLIIEYKKDLNKGTIKTLLSYAKNQFAIAKLLGQNHAFWWQKGPGVMNFPEPRMQKYGRIQ